MPCNHKCRTCPPSQKYFIWQQWTSITAPLSVVRGPSVSIHVIWKLTAVQTVGADKRAQQVWQQVCCQRPSTGRERNSYIVVLWPPSSHHGILTHIHTIIGTLFKCRTSDSLQVCFWSLPLHETPGATLQPLGTLSFPGPTRLFLLSCSWLNSHWPFQKNMYRDKH